MESYTSIIYCYYRQSGVIRAVFFLLSYIICIVHNKKYMTKGKKQMKIAVIKNSLFRKLMLVICFCLLLYSQIYISFAITGNDFDPNKPTTCAITLPRFSSGPRYCSDIGDSRGPCVYANVNF